MIRFFFIAFTFLIASIFIWKKELNPKGQFIGIYSLFLGALGAGMTISHAPSYGKAKDSASKIFAIIDEKSTIDARDPKGE